MPKKSKGYFHREPDSQLEDLRDDCIAVVLNSKLSFQQVAERGGPTTQTISKWLYRETKFPRLGTVRSILRACDHDITIAPTGDPRIQRLGWEGIEMPPKPKKAKAPSKIKAKLEARRKDRREKISKK